MIWLTWRQHRAVLAVTSAFVVALIVWMLIVEHSYSETLHAISRSCPSGLLYSDTGPCNGLYSQQASAWEQADFIRYLILALPLVFGALLGAPLFAGEFERKTVLLAFTQGISRTRWMVIRWIFVALAVLALASAFALVANWWFGKVPTNGSSFGLRIEPGSFDITGMVPVAYALFGFALGAALGMVLRRTARAIFGTVVLFVVVRAFVEHYVRPYLAARSFLPDSAVAYGGGANMVVGQASVSWYLGSGYRVAPGSGHPTSQAYLNHVFDVCGSPYGANWGSCVTNHGVQFGTFYQPSSHYWALQWGETTAFVVAAGVLFGVALWSVRRWRA